MLDNILDQLKGQLGPDLMEKFGLDEAKKDQVFSAAKDSIKTNVKNEAAGGGGLEGLLNMFSKGENNDAGNAMQSKIGGDMIAKIAAKAGIDESKAAGIQEMILSQVTKMMGDKKGGSFDISSLLSMVTGGGDSKSGGGNFLSKIFSMFGGKK